MNLSDVLLLYLLVVCTYMYNCVMSALCACRCTVLKKKSERWPNKNNLINSQNAVKTKTKSKPRMTASVLQEDLNT